MTQSIQTSLMEAIAAPAAIARITVLLALAWSVHFVLRVANPRWRILLWRANAIGIVVVAVASLFAPTVTWRVLPSFTPERSSRQFAGRRFATIDSKSESVESERRSGTNPTSNPRRFPNTADTIPSVEPKEHPATDSMDIETESAHPTANRPARSRLEFWMVAIWLGGTAAMLIRFAAGARTARRIARSALPAPTCVRSMARDLTRDHVDESEPDVRSSDWSVAPCSVGIVRPVVLLPEALCVRGTTDEIRGCLAHEFVHLAGHDLSWNALLELVAAALWFHPLVWRIRLAHADACDDRCDAVAADMMGDAPGYGRLLARTALRSAASTPTMVMSMAGSSRIVRRIALLPHRRGVNQLSGVRIAALLVAYAVVATSVGLLSIGRRSVVAAQLDDTEHMSVPENLAADENKQPAETPADEKTPKAVVTSALKDLRESIESVRSAHIEFYQFVQVAPRFKSDVSPDQFALWVVTNDVVGEPEALVDVIRRATTNPQLVKTPWGEMELHMEVGSDGNLYRETLRRAGHAESDVHIQTPDVAIRWDSAISQVTVCARQDDRVGLTNLADLWPRMGLGFAKLELDSLEVVNLHGRARFMARDADGQIRAYFDPATSLPVELVVQSDIHSRRTQWLGWHSASGILVPRVVVKLVSRNDEIEYGSVLITRRARFNMTLPDEVFGLGAPAGSTIVDRRGDHRVVRINRDVFDVTSRAEVRAAAERLQEELTETEKKAIEKLRRRYVLENDEVLKRLGPPFPLSRNYLGRMLLPGSGPRRQEIYYILAQRAGKPEYHYGFGGKAPTMGKLISCILGHPLVDVDIPENVLERELAGDYVFRPNATKDVLAAEISRVLSDETGRNVSLVYEDVEKPVYVAEGALRIDETKTIRRSIRGEVSTVIAVNSGPYSGAFGESIGSGNLSRLLTELGGYIGVKVIDETTPSGRELTWSKRFYDRAAVGQGNGFRIDPDTVLRMVEDQTGIRFSRSTRKVSVIRLSER